MASDSSEMGFPQEELYRPLSAFNNEKSLNETQKESLTIKTLGHGKSNSHTVVTSLQMINSLQYVDVVGWLT